MLNIELDIYCRRDFLLFKLVFEASIAQHAVKVENCKVCNEIRSIFHAIALAKKTTREDSKIQLFALREIS